MYRREREKVEAREKPGQTGPGFSSEKRRRILLEKSKGVDDLIEDRRLDVLVEDWRRRGQVAGIDRFENEREVDAGVVAHGGVTDPIEETSRRAFRTALFEELRAVDRDVAR